MKALLRIIAGVGGGAEIRTPDGVFDRVRAEASGTSDDSDTSPREG
jgi:hypothetical protein